MRNPANLACRRPGPDGSRYSSRLSASIPENVSSISYFTAALSHIEKPGERDSHKAVPIAVTPHRPIAAEVPFAISTSPKGILTISVRPKLSSRAFWHKVSDTSRQFDEWCEEPGERDSHKAVPIAATPHRLIAAEVPLELSFLARLSTFASTANFFRGETPRDAAVGRESPQIAVANAV